jgi:hypothetical protein
MTTQDASRPGAPFPTGRVVAGGAALIALVGAVVPALANFDTSSTVGISAGLLAVAGVAIKWLQGWQSYEARDQLISVGAVGTAARTSDTGVDAITRSALGAIGAVTPQPELDPEEPPDVPMALSSEEEDMDIEMDVPPPEDGAEPESAGQPVASAPPPVAGGSPEAEPPAQPAPEAEGEPGAEQDLGVEPGPDPIVETTADVDVDPEQDEPGDLPDVPGEEEVDATALEPPDIPPENGDEALPDEVEPGPEPFIPEAAAADPGPENGEPNGEPSDLPDVADAEGEDGTVLDVAPEVDAEDQGPDEFDAPAAVPPAAVGINAAAVAQGLDEIDLYGEANRVTGTTEVDIEEALSSDPINDEELEGSEA